MNRYDWAVWGFRLLVGGANLNGVKMLVRELATVPDMTGPEKREEVKKQWLDAIREALPDALKEGAEYLLRAIINLILVKLNA